MSGTITRELAASIAIEVAQEACSREGMTEERARSFRTLVASIADAIRRHVPERPAPRPRITTTHTHAYLDVGAATFEDVRDRLEAVGYSHTFGDDDGRRTVNMHGIALRETKGEGR